jgi:hypothetical protein
MNLGSSKDESLLALWESVRRQVAADLATGGRCRFVGENVRAYAHQLRGELDKRSLRYTPIDWQ